MWCIMNPQKKHQTQACSRGELLATLCLSSRAKPRPSELVAGKLITRTTSSCQNLFDLKICYDANNAVDLLGNALSFES